MAVDNLSAVKPYILRKLRGRVGGIDPINIEDDQFRDLKNWYPFSGELWPRNGLERVSGIPFGSLITGLFGYNVNEVWQVIFGHQTGIGKMSADEMVNIAQEGDVPTISSSTEPWIFKEYKNTVYAVRRDVGVLLRTDGISVGVAGITPPSTAPTMAQGGAGELKAGDYYGVYTFYNSLTDAESDYSPVPAAAVTIVDDKKILWSNLEVSSQNQINARRLFRTIKNQEGAYYLAVTIDNVGDTYEEGTILDEMGDAVSLENGLPPSALVTIETFGDRLWASDGKWLYYSRISLPESFGAYSSIPVAVSDGFDIVGLKEFNERLLIGKGGSTHYLTGTEDQSFSVRVLSDKHGVKSHHSMVTAEGLAGWYGGDNLYISDGNGVWSIGTTEVKDLLDTIGPSYERLVWGVADPDLPFFYWGIPSDDTKVNKVIAFNYKSQDFSVFEYDSNIGAPTAVALFKDDDENEILYCTPHNSGGHVYRFDSGDTDAGYDISYLAWSKNYGYEEDDRLKFMKEIQTLIQTAAQAEDVTVTLYRDDQAYSTYTNSFNTYGGRMWKRLPLSNNGDLANFMSLKIEYSGKPLIKLLGLGFKVVTTRRRVPVS